jgi:hypothetical protein
MVIKVGLIGFSEGNGHPYSFSAIVNGYNPEIFKTSGWDGIYNYLERKDSSDFGITDFSINSIWTQDNKLSETIAAACNIANICDTPEKMLSQVDAVIIARDDWQSHYSLALPFLEAGKPVFVDKPLSLDIKELKELKPYLMSGLLMSCAALRYAVEFDQFREDCLREPPSHINGNILIDWERYGVHLLDGIFSAIPFNVKSIFSSGDKTRVSILSCKDGRIITLNCLGSTAKTFNISTYSSTSKASYEVDDNFSAFKRTLSNFRNMIITGKPSIPPDLTLNIMKTLIAGNISKSENRVVNIDEITI